MKMLIAKLSICIALISMCILISNLNAADKKPTIKEAPTAPQESTIEESFEFKGKALGDSIEKFTDTTNYTCQKYDEQFSVLGDTVCATWGSVAGHFGPIRYYFYDDKLYTIDMRIDAWDFDDVVNALHEKYGASKRETGTVQNRAGANFENVTYTWKRKKALLTATKYAGTIDRSSINFRLNAADEEYKKREAERAKKAASEL